MAVEGIEQLLLGRGKANPHVREFVVDEAGIQACDQGSGHGSGENKDGKSGDGASEDTQSRMFEGADLFSGFGRISKHAVLLEDTKARE